MTDTDDDRSSKAFGRLLYKYRTHLSSPRHTQVWLGKKLRHDKFLISKWEQGTEAAQMPTRQMILNIGRLYSLHSEEVEALLAAAKESFAGHRPEKVGEYEPLTKQEAKAWRVALGPSRVSLEAWQEVLAHAQKSHRWGEWHAARQAAGAVTEQTRAAVADPDIGDLWDFEEWQKMDQLYLAAWDEFSRAGQRLSRRKRRTLRSVVAADPQLAKIMRTIVWLSFPVPPSLRKYMKDPEGTRRH